MPDKYCPTQVYLCTEFYGNPLAFNDEMENARFESVSEIMEQEILLCYVRISDMGEMAVQAAKEATAKKT
jgi:hypothetical protein